MILSETVSIRINPANYKHFYNIGYTGYTINENIDVHVNDLTNGSHSIIKCCCDKCGKEKMIMYKTYHKICSKDMENKYFCTKCVKTERTYSNGHHMKNNEILKKVYNTKKEKYGDGKYNNMNKMKITKKEKYGDEYYTNIEKTRKTCMERYSVENYSSSKESKESYKMRCLEKYGVESFVETLEFKEKRDETFKKYEGGHPLSDPKQRKIITDTKVEKGLQVRKDNLTEFEKYSNSVRNKSKKFRNLLIEKWDGFDYYDGEFIKNNFELNCNDNNYPCIDHKISIFYGFLNNIPITTISDIENLCITKRVLNSIKNHLTDDEFKKSLNCSKYSS